jgi:hypothetical protein
MGISVSLGCAARSCMLSMYTLPRGLYMRRQNILELTNLNFDELVGQSKAVVIEFYAPCAQFPRVVVPCLPL